MRQSPLPKKKHAKFQLVFNKNEVPENNNHIVGKQNQKHNQHAIEESKLPSAVVAKNLIRYNSHARRSESSVKIRICDPINK